MVMGEKMGEFQVDAFGDLRLGCTGYELTLQKAVTKGSRAAAIPCSSIWEQS